VPRRKQCRLAERRPVENLERWSCGGRYPRRHSDTSDTRRSAPAPPARLTHDVAGQCRKVERTDVPHRIVAAWSSVNDDHCPSDVKLDVIGDAIHAGVVRSIASTDLSVGEFVYVCTPTTDCVIAGSTRAIKIHLAEIVESNVPLSHTE